MGISVINSDLTVEGSVLGQKAVLTLSGPGEEYGVELGYVCGSVSGTIGRNARVFDWTPPLSLAEQSPGDSWVSVELTLDILRKGKVIESRRFPAAFFIPEDIGPSLELKAEDTQGYVNYYGGFVQGKSRARLRANAQGMLGSTVDRVWMRCGFLSGVGETLEFDLPEAGDCNLRAMVRDSRGRKAEAEGIIPVLKYASPEGEILKAERCGENGEADEAGQWLRVTFRGQGAELEGVNTVSYTLSLCPEGEDTWQDYPAAVGTAVEQAQLLLPVGAGDFALRLIVSDDFETVVVPYVPEGPALLDICQETHAIGIGCRGDRTGTVSFGMGVQMQGNTLTGLPEPKAPEDALTLGFAGGLYWHPRLLWENSAPGNAFAAQTVAVAAAGFGVLEAADCAGKDSRVYELIAAGVPGQIRCLSGDGAAYRPFSWSSEGIVFQDAPAGNTRAVPIRVYALTEN